MGVVLFFSFFAILIFSLIIFPEKLKTRNNFFIIQLARLASAAIPLLSCWLFCTRVDDGDAIFALITSSAILLLTRKQGKRSRYSEFRMSATIVLFGLTYFLSAILFAPMPQAETRTIKIAFCVLYIIGFLLEQLGVFSDSPLKALLKGRAERRSKNKLEKLRFEYHDLHRAADEKKDEFEQRAGGLSLRIAPIEVPPAEMQADLEAQAELEVEANTQAKDLRLHPTPSK